RNQASYTDVGKYNSRMEMTLNQALKAIKSRGRSIPVDGIYSILGLLPYGEWVVPKYKGKLCKECKKLENERKKEIICKHPEEQKEY
ncbi:9502_t:CDS:2, partial [Ambispora gerdemannii]